MNLKRKMVLEMYRTLEAMYRDCIQREALCGLVIIGEAGLLSFTAVPGHGVYT